MDDKFCWPCSQKEVTKLPPCPLQCKSPNCPSFKKPPPVDLSKKFFLWVMGATGSGRSSQCEKIAQKYRFHRICPAHLLQKESECETARGRCVASVLHREEIAPNDLVMELIKPIVEQQALVTPNSPPGYVIDGFPREERQGLWFEKTIAPVNLILYIEVPLDVLMERHLPLRNPDKTYALAKSKLDRAASDRRATEEDIMIRREEMFRHRVKTFYDNANHIVEQYPHRLVKIDGKKSGDQIFAEIVAIIDKYLLQHGKILALREAELKRDTSCGAFKKFDQ